MTPIKNIKIHSVLLLAVILFFFSVRPAPAANYTVTMSGTAFNPVTLTIGIGDRVTWTNTSTGLGSTHTSTRSDTFCGTNGFGTNFWNSGDMLSHATYSFTFTNFAAGTYPYLCVQHCSQFGMKGTLILTNPPNVLPTVNVTNPAPGTVFTAPANVTIQASASDTDGSVTNVQLLVGPTVLTNDTTVPYDATTNGLPAGTYDLSAVASDNRGGKATNSVNITVNAPPSISLTNPISNAKLRAPANIPLQATAGDIDGTVTNVQFFSGGSLLGGVTDLPYNFTLSNTAAGNYTFTTRAVDNRGAATTSGVVNVFVLTNAILTSPARLPDGQFHFTILGIAGQTYATEASANLTDWSAFATNVAPADSFNVTDSTSTNILLRFYRARQDL